MAGNDDLVVWMNHHDLRVDIEGGGGGPLGGGQLTLGCNGVEGVDLYERDRYDG